MVIATEKIDVLIRNGGAVCCQGGDGITHIERPADGDYCYDADIWKILEDPDDYGTYNVIHVGNHF